MSNGLIPFIILEAHPDYKRPYVLPFYGVTEKHKLEDVILEKIVDFVYERIDVENLNSVEDITNFWENFYSDSYMGNLPVSANAFIDGEWISMDPSDEDIFTKLKTLLSTLFGEENSCEENSCEDNSE